MMLLPVVILLFGGASVAEGFQATPAVTARTSLYLRPRQSSCLFVSSEEDEATSALTQQQPTENTSTEPVQRPRIENQRRSNNEPSPLDLMRAMGTSPRRVFLSVLTSTFIAFAANFFGVTSNLLSTLPESFAEKTGLDQFYPRGDYKRVTVRGDVGQGKCSFVIPKDWVADTSLALAQAQRRAKVLDYSMKPDQMGVLPDAAYGPPGKTDRQGLSNRETNVSVIINGVKDFTLKGTLGSDPKAAAEILLSNKFGPRRPTTLISSFEEIRGENNIPIYQFEYTVDRGDRAPPLHAISVIAGSVAGDAFVTLTVVSLDRAWTGQADDSLRQIAKSFKLV
ncbi:PsbP domain-containing protein [Skeletonema marinoi]|uniref:PsbP domain-containing protein n=1 Tax=Skeletonema marinoi TaxID=267567 RepID=A0AAD9DIJ9_9STRA|nr:PsbP domain-containing protein [Skeletonema marinoi]|mmetsp:Transcript_4034/g.8509  ORF Transcript_4034/g.8509 Transcript_4034/m.8509 type:complete len:338 (-) Transcript_4034:839-1852(-)